MSRVLSAEKNRRILEVLEYGRVTSPFFKFASDFMAEGPAGGTRWTAVNEALAFRLGWSPEEAVTLDLRRHDDPGQVLARDGTYVSIDWKVWDESGVLYWIGREKKPDVLREMHHRLLNNFQFVVSLLAFQSARVSDPGVQKQLAKAEARVRTVARLHESAHVSRDFSQVEFGGYLRRLVHDIPEIGPTSVKLETNDVALSMEQAVPLAMIAHELVTNAVEYAHAGVILVSLRYAGSDRLTLRVVDDGPGTGQAPSAVGLELVRLFVEQLRGISEMGPGPGVDISITFDLIS